MTEDEFVPLALRTLSPQFHEDLFLPQEMGAAISAALVGVEWIDGLKKALFYGKAPARLRAIAASSTSYRYRPDLADLTHAILGIYTEAGELLQALSQALQGEDLDAVNLTEELGDLLWYLALLEAKGGISLTEARKKNIQKLKTRYPERFSSEAANSRDLDAERKALE